MLSQFPFDQSNSLLRLVDVLLLLVHSAANFEVGHQLEDVHVGGHAAPGAVDELADLVKKGSETVRLRFDRGDRFFDTDGFFMDQAG